jgi:hypothetical protein
MILSISGNQTLDTGTETWSLLSVIGAVGQAEQTNAGAAMQGDRQGEARGAL